MKLIRCNNCDDVVRLVHTKWKTCECGKSGGQYNDDLITATIGGDCEVIGLRNDFFKEKPFSKKRNDKASIIQGEYLGDDQIHRIKSPKGPKLKIEVKDNGNGTHDIIFKDKRDYTVNIKGGDKKPKELKSVPSNKVPSFKNKKVTKESFISIKKIIKEEMEDFDWTNDIDPLQSFDEYFYKSRMGKYIKRGIEWWENWIEEVEAAHTFILEDVDELRSMVEDLINPTNDSFKYYLLSYDVRNYLSPQNALNGKSILLDSASKIHESYTELGDFTKENNLTILETLNIFQQWLNKRRNEGKPLH